jgi:signal peptidase II
MKAILSSRFVLFWGLAAGGCAIDLATKRWIFDRLGMPGAKPTEWLWDNVFGLTTSLNEGALFGIGQGQVTLFALLSVVALVGILYWLFVSGAAEDWLLTFALGLVTAGIFGNLYDRLGLPGLKWDFPLARRGDSVKAVRDWLHFQIQGLIDWPIFNIADSLLVCGAGLLIWHAFTAELKARSGRVAETATPPSAVERATSDSAGPKRPN